VPLKSLLATVPNKKIPYEHVSLLLEHGILQMQPPTNNLEAEWKLGKDCNASHVIGFPNADDQRLSGSTKTGAKRRLAHLKRQLKGGSKKAKSNPSMDNDGGENSTFEAIEDEEENANDTATHLSLTKDWSLPTEEDPDFLEEPVLEREKEARQALKDLLHLEHNTPQDEGTMLPTSILPRQVSYAGTHPVQQACFDEDNRWLVDLDPRIVNCVKRRLYRHQAVAIESALRNIPTLVCTGTGSGKSLCFLVPVLNAALKGEKSMLLFPTKALAQDQVVKLSAWLEECNLHHDIRAATLDGDTPHSQRMDIITSCNVILTNPDTLHAGVMPNWKHLYRPLLTNLRYVVIDEAHMYTGIFGAHVTMILARLYRLVSLESSKLCFLACSATLAHPEAHFRILCCIPKQNTVNIVKEDGSPRSAKHFLVWNPPLLDMNGKSLGRVERRRKNANKDANACAKSRDKFSSPQLSMNVCTKDEVPPDMSSSNPLEVDRKAAQHRRHSADETALLFALAVSKGVRCIVFCKTRCLVEWVYERTLQALKSSSKTADLCKQVESYRGGYTKAERRLIETKLFNNQLLGVVGTSALELGVDIGGVDLTLHCGFPTSHENLIQQSGRAGRGANSSTSLAICVCFNSPMDQHLWRHPTSLLSRGYSAPLSMPIFPGLVQDHLLCAGHEYPLTGPLNVSVLQSSNIHFPKYLLSDMDLFGSRDVYMEALESLIAQGSVTQEKVAITAGSGQAIVYKTHPSIKNPSNQVSIRSMEPVTYQIVDTSHPIQAGRTDAIHDEAAVLDTIPYSRIFYHAFPGAVITHRSRRYRIMCMTRPPAFGKGFRGNVALGAFAKPCSLHYYTRPLSSLKITVVKQMERVDVPRQGKSKTSGSVCMHTTPVPDVNEVFSPDGPDPSFGSFAGCGVVTVKRNVHGYKKLSIVTREEITRSELSLPDMEFDSFAFWIDCDAEILCPQLADIGYGHGVHALAHACVAVAPLFVPCTTSDVYCDHMVHGPTRVTVFDSRAGGSGICAQLWKCLFIPNGLLEKALNLLEECPSCADDLGYDGGCPACLHAGECIKFNDYLSKSSGIVVAKHMIQRLKETDTYKANETAAKAQEEASSSNNSDNRSSSPSQPNINDVGSPRRKRRERAMRHAQDMVSARDRQVVVGRPCWPMDRSDGPRGQENTE
jgi:DEAD/DEAH box helicase domain-containing protein